MKLNLYHLITFYFVATEKSFSITAEKLFLTEPAISLQIKSLERCMGIKLLNVQRKKVYLTKAGELLLPYAEEIYKQAKSAEQAVENIRENNLRIGAAVTFSSIIAAAASRFENLFPHVKLSIRNGPSHQIIDGLLDLQYDIAVVVALNYQTSKLRVIKTADCEEIVLVTSPSNPILPIAELNLAELCRYPLLLPPEGSATREILLESLGTEEGVIRPFILMETDYLECSKRLAEEGKGIALTHLTNVEREVAQGKLRIIPLSRKIKIGADILVHREIPLPPIGERFISLVEETFEARHSHQAIGS